MKENFPKELTLDMPIDEEMEFAKIKTIFLKHKATNRLQLIPYETIIKEFGISNKNFLDLLVNYDEVLKSTDDETAISSIINQVLVKYEEVVISGG